MLATENHYFKMLLDEAKRTLESGGLESYAAMLGTYDRQKLETLTTLLSYGPFRQAMLGQLYECNDPLDACRLKKKIGETFAVHPADLGWYRRHFYTRERVLAAKYDGAMVDRRALLKAKVQLRVIERDSRRALRRKLSETHTRKRRIWRLPLFR